MRSITFDIDTLKALDAKRCKAVIRAGLKAGLYNAEEASAYAAECELEKLARKLRDRAGLSD